MSGTIGISDNWHQTHSKMSPTFAKNVHCGPTE